VSIQDRKTTARVPISASDVAMLLEAAGVDRMLSLDLHCGQIQARALFLSLSLSLSRSLPLSPGQIG
jgi:phosphoribosylpyrophosphate synthetase